MDSTDIIQTTAERYFGITKLHPMQRIVIEDILSVCCGASRAEDSSPNRVVLLPTGAGKTLCFMVPALIIKKPTLIIYPLLALMADQERRLKQSGIPYAVFKGGQSEAERDEQFNKISCEVSLLLANPEILQNDKIQERLAKAHIAHLVIDEAHCVSTWGMTFRPSYLALGKIADKLSPQSISAFTATADDKVLQDMSYILFKGNMRIIRGAGDRANIHYYVRKAYAKNMELIRLSITEKQPMLIFCRSRLSAEKLSQMLCAYHGKSEVRFYHAGLERDERKDVENWFFSRRTGILTATCAYGMGVDKSDIRTVIHYDPPDSVIEYAQESGRGGRDGNITKAILLMSHTDSQKQKGFVKELAESAVCKRKIILKALGDPYADNVLCGGCSVCDKETQKARDAENAICILKSQRKLLSLQGAGKEIQSCFNKADRELFGKYVWTHSDVMDILRQVLDERKIRVCMFFWNGKIQTLKCRPVFCHHGRHLLRLLHFFRAFFQMIEHVF